MIEYCADMDRGRKKSFSESSEKGTQLLSFDIKRSLVHRAFYCEVKHLENQLKLT